MLALTTQEETLKEKIYDNRWLPPSPHKEAVIDFIKKGRAHIEERGHNVPPLLICEDGGALELPRVRYANGRFIVDETYEANTTKYTDVCGTIDEFKELLKDESTQPDAPVLTELLDDAEYMVQRMGKRLEKYEEFREAVGHLWNSMQDISEPDFNRAKKKSDQIRAFLRDSPSDVNDNLELLYSLAEEIRDVANKLEKSLYAHRDAAIKLGSLHEEIKGARNWGK